MRSVVVSVYNEERYFEGCIRSILAQDYPKEDLELLFVDGMSSDATCQRLEQYEAIYPWIRVIDNR